MNGHNIPTQFTPTTAEDWRRAKHEGYTIPLPSGLYATVKTVPLDQLVEGGKIPDFLTGVAAKSLWSEAENQDIASSEELSREYLELINFIVPMAMVSPKMVVEPDYGKGEISIKDMDFMDKVCVFNLSIQPSGVLKTFRDQQEKRMAALRRRENDELSSELDNPDIGQLGSLSI